MTWQKAVINVKFWIQRTMGYVAVVNMFLLAYLVLSRMADKGQLPFAIGKALVGLAVLIAIGMVVFGYFEDKLGLAEEEFRLNAQRMGLSGDKR